jgi:alkylated DNA nucleotide flippase Atl1
MGLQSGALGGQRAPPEQSCPLGEVARLGAEMAQTAVTKYAAWWRVVMSGPLGPAYNQDPVTQAALRFGQTGFDPNAGPAAQVAQMGALAAALGRVIGSVPSPEAQRVLFLSLPDLAIYADYQTMLRQLQSSLLSFQKTLQLGGQQAQPCPLGEAARLGAELAQTAVTKYAAWWRVVMSGPLGQAAFDLDPVTQAALKFIRAGFDPNASSAAQIAQMRALAAALGQVIGSAPSPEAQKVLALSAPDNMIYADYQTMLRQLQSSLLSLQKTLQAFYGM